MLVIEPDFQEFLNTNFNFIESKFEGAVDIYSSETLKLRIVRDRNGKLYMDISTLENPATPSDWIILNDLCSYILDNDDYLKETDFKKVSFFFRENYHKIVELLKTSYDNTISALEKRGNHRAELRWGPIKTEKKDMDNIVNQPEEKQIKKSWWKL